MDKNSLVLFQTTAQSLALALLHVSAKYGSYHKATKILHSHKRRYHVIHLYGRGRKRIFYNTKLCLGIFIVETEKEQANNQQFPPLGQI